MLVDFFPVALGLVVVRNTGIDLLDASDAVVTTVASASEITAAAFDGALLGVADRQTLNVYDTSLALQRTIALPGPCASAVVVSRSRFVCGGGDEWDRTFSVYDLSTGARLFFASAGDLGHGIPMRRVPGTDDFITVTERTSPSDYYLHRVTAEDAVASFGDSPYHGEFYATTTLAFDGSPAEHLIQRQGILLRIYGGRCGDDGVKDCFIRDGMLGTLNAQQAFIALADDGAGSLFAVVSSVGDFGAYCTLGCRVQRIDIEKRLVVRELHLSFHGVKMVAARWDPHLQRFLFGYLNGEDAWSPVTGYEIQAFTP